MHGLEVAKSLAFKAMGARPVLRHENSRYYMARAGQPAASHPGAGGYASARYEGKESRYGSGKCKP
jgi:hypothetical protein